MFNDILIKSICHTEEIKVCATGDFFVIDTKYKDYYENGFSTIVIILNFKTDPKLNLNIFWSMMLYTRD